MPLSLPSPMPRASRRRDVATYPACPPSTTARRALATAFLLAFGSGAWAQSSDHPSSPQRLDRVVVTGNPTEHADLFDLVSPVTVLSGTGLSLKREGTLGETLSSVPGVSSSYFGPNASRPVIRGMDSARIRLLQNGIGTIDASALSNDHATAIDPLFIQSIEVVRGPAALLYGGSAVGGVVNVIDGRIPRERSDGVAGAAEVKAGGPEHLKSAAAYVDFGREHLVLHADGFDRRSSDLVIPDYAHSTRQRARDDPSLGQPTGRLPNSASHAYGGAFGASYVDTAGYVGLSVASTRNTYGTVAEEGSTIRMKQDRGDLAGELRDLGFIRKVKFKAGYTDYRHTEFNGGVQATTFKNLGYEARVDAIHERVGLLDGAFGLQYGDSTFSALGEEAFVPLSKTRDGALFAFEELHLDPVTLSGTVRVEKTRLAASGGGPVDPPTGLARFGVDTSRDFTAVSGSLGANYKLTPALSLVFTGTSTQRTPTYFELFANGVHAATRGYEIGDASFAKETSRSFEAAIRARQGRFSGSLSVYRTLFSNYIGLFATGNTRDGAGNLNPAPDPAFRGVTIGGDEILTEYRYRQVPALFTGFEAEGKVRLIDGARTLDFEGSVDRVRTTNRETGQPLPRIAPMRFRAALDVGVGPAGGQLEMIHARKQDHVPDGELPTDGYTLVNAYLTYAFRMAGADMTAYLRALNLFDQDARVSTSFLRDISPLPGRGFQVGLRSSF